MFRSVLFACFVILSIGMAHAQYGNEWINHAQSYYKFKVSEDGLYRISSQVLASAGLASVRGDAFRLYRNGEEVAIYTTSSGVFGAGDFIEFYGFQNRGEADRFLFDAAEFEQLNRSYSMFSDEAAYFLTWEEDADGKRIFDVDNDITNPPFAETFYMHEDRWVFHDRNVDPRNALESSPISLSRFQEAEGFASEDLDFYNLQIPTPDFVTAGPDAQFELRLATTTLTNHDLNVLLNGDTLLKANDSNFELYHVSKAIESGALTASQTLSISNTVANARFAISEISWVYPRQYDFSGRTEAHFKHPAFGQDQYFELQNFDHGNTDPIVYDLNARERLISSRNGNTVRFTTFPYQGERDFHIVRPDAILAVTALEPRTFSDYSGDNAQFIIISHPSLRTGDDAVGQYAAYRASAEGGAYEVGIYDILELTDQFGYGIENHPQAIRNFYRMLSDHWTSEKYVLIIGKGITYTIAREKGSAEEEMLLIPTMGQPGADHLLITNNGVSLPGIPIGRIPATNQTQILSYLSKLKEYDQVRYLPQTIEDRGWTKQVLHMGGGQDASQQAQLLEQLRQMGDTARLTEMGAFVHTFSKSSTNTTGESNSDKILKLLRNGLSIVKFYGHSSASTLDFQINNPGEWLNKGRYPIFSAMGCKAGDIHQPFLSLGESFIFEPDAGTIAFLAGSGSQYQIPLGTWGKQWYSAFGHGVNTISLGESIIQSLGKVNGGLSTELLIEQQTLTGDPAIHFHGSPGTDYVWDYPSVRFTPDVLSTDLKSFKLTADVVNLGTSVADTVYARVEQKTPAGQIEEVFYGRVALSGYRTTLEFEISLNQQHSGANTYYLTIDVANERVELPAPIAEENNVLVDGAGKEGIDIFILDNRAQTTFPLEFSIVTDESVELIASSTNAFIKGARFVMELDTVPEFNSPVLSREYFSGFGGVLRWKPTADFVPGKVYYWRVSTDSQTGDYLWDTSSFLYQPGGRKGWNQSHYGQFAKDILTGLGFDRNKRLDLDTIFRNVWIQNKVDYEPDPILVDDPVLYVNNNLRRDFFTFYQFYDAHIWVAVVDSFNGRFIPNPPGGAHGSLNLETNNIVVYPFNTATPESRNNLVNFLENVVGDGQFVIMTSYQRNWANHMEYFPAQWAADEQLFGKSIFSVVEAQAPGSIIRSLETRGSLPYLIYYRKNRELIQESIANVLEETISYDYNFVSHSDKGELRSTKIGPAKKWSSFEWDFDFSNNPSQDAASAQLIALAANPADTMTADTIFVDVTSQQEVDLDFIDARDYPFIYLKFNVTDASQFTAPRVNFWRVYYEGVPDYLIDPTGGFDFEGDSLMVGQPINLTTNVENLGFDATESCQIRFVLTDEFNNSKEVISDIPPLASGESTLIHLNQEMTDDHPGKNSLFIELNPDRTINESSYQNNTALLSFVLLGDRSNPLLDVTFDGRHLIDGDIVSSQPVIVAALRDENPFMLMDDRGAYEVLLRYPGDFDYTELDVHHTDFAFEPALSAQDNVARLYFRPTLADGFYDLIVRGHDRTDNASGNVEYQITFEVLGDRLLSRIDVEPSVFSDHTSFIFTLTGSETPSEISLRICDATGRIVRDIGKDEIGTFVGTTEYRWDGRSDGGDVLPSGMYFYQLLAKDADGNAYDYLSSGFQSLRNAHTGKVIIVR